MEAMVTVVIAFPLQDVMILANIMEFLATQHVQVEARILFMQRNPDHADVQRTRDCIQFLQSDWPIAIETSIIREDVGWRGKENQSFNTRSATTYDKGFRVQFYHWSTILLTRYAAISKDWCNSTGVFGDRLVQIQTHNPRSRSYVDEITVHDNDNEYHVIAGCEILFTLVCRSVRRPLHSQ